MKDRKKLKYINPDFLYVPFQTKLRQKEGDNIYNEEIIALCNNKIIYSPVSGIVLKEIEIDTLEGKVKSVIIENDFKEKRKKLFSSYHKLYDLTREELNNLLKSFSIEYDKKIYLKIFYKKDINSESLLFSENIQEILEFLDVINTYQKKEVYLLVNSNDLYTIDALNKYKESYPNIKVIYDDKKITEGVSVYEILKVYNILKKKRLGTTKYISVLSKNQNYDIEVKLYTKVSDILKELNIESNDIKIMDINGVIIDANKDFIITDRCTCILTK